MDTISTILLVGILIAVIINSILQQQRHQQIQSMAPDPAAIAGHVKVPTTQDMVGALSGALTDAKISDKIGEFTELSRNMEDTTKKFHQMTISKSKRAGWGEWYLDQELKEAFPGVKIRQEVKELGNLKPDAHMRTPDGKILIVDSKFVYDTYNTYLETPETQVKGRDKLLTTFRGDIEKHVNKIKTDYVQPGKGTHEFAFMFIPSEGVYHFLIEHESKTVRWAATQGVVICSPMTLMANMHMLEIARMAQNMKDAHNEILDTHLRVKKSYEEFEGEWKILSKHLMNSLSKHTEATGKLNQLTAEITALSALDKSIEDGSEEE